MQPRLALPLATDDALLDQPAPGQLVPPRAFHSPSIYELEQRAIFARSWVHVADLIDVPGPGDYAAASIGRTPVLLVRDRESGELRGFLNACRHRGAQLVEGRGHCERQLRCPYHAWSYGTDGRLIGVPHREEFECDLSQRGLVPIRVGVAGPMIFACLDPEAPELGEWLGQLPEALAAAGAGSWNLAFEMSYEMDANWKLFVENANDGYHVEFVHDILTDVVVLESGVTTLEPHGAYSIADVNPAYVPPDFDPAMAKIRFGSIFPNLVPVLSPGDLTYIRVDPVALDRLRLFVRSYDDQPDDSQLREFRRQAFIRTTEQDIQVVLRVQRGLHAHGLPPGVHSSLREARIAHFERLWVDALAAAPFSSRAPRFREG
ncbi:MAG TPA: aromatic ring-hydroxylating dioxygenase subunit alpha [Kofleriaceae bacterium]|nr:aromatic ring-hydroxylating dioxygenase subunit alpha [Kofleriaceae bacterium]